MTRPDIGPAYRRLSPEGLAEKAGRAEAMLKSCTLCPRECEIDRTAGELGFCKTGDRPFVSSWGPHLGEGSEISFERLALEAGLTRLDGIETKPRIR